MTPLPFLIASAALAATPAMAAPVGFEGTTPNVLFEGATLGVFDTPGGLDLSVFSPATNSEGVNAEATFLTLIAVVGITPFGALSAAGGGFGIDSPTDTFLAGTFEALAVQDGAIFLRFDEISGSEAGAFGSPVIATLDFGGALGDDPFARFVSDQTYPVDVTVSALIPLPQTTILTLGALAALVAASGRIGSSRRRTP